MEAGRSQLQIEADTQANQSKHIIFVFYYRFVSSPNMHSKSPNQKTGKKTGNKDLVENW